MANAIDWGTLRQRIIAGIALILIAGAWSFASTRASSEDVEILAERVAEEIAEVKNQHKEDTAKMVKTLHAIDAKTSAIAIVLDRIDKQNNGPGMPPGTMDAEPVE